MRKKKLYRDIKNSVTHSWGRFISIMLLMAIGSLALVGLTVTGPDMRKTGEDYFKKYNTADLIIVLGDYGLDKSEENYIKKAHNIKDIEYGYFKDVVIKGTKNSIRVFSKPKDISLYELVQGRLPQKDNEIAISSVYKGRYRVGDTISFNEKKENDKFTLKTHQFKIVGFINSSEMISKLTLGQSTAGTGELNGYAVINDDDFDSDVYMIARLTFTDTENLNPYSDEYDDKIKAHKKELSKLLNGRQQGIRLADIKDDYQKLVDDGQKELDKAKGLLESSKEQLQKGASQIKQAKGEIEANEVLLEGGQKQIEGAKKEITSNEKILNEAKLKLDASKAEILQNKEELNSKKAVYNNSLNEYSLKEKELENAKKEIENSQAEIDNNRKSLEDAKAQYEATISEIKDAIKQALEELQKPELSDEDREDINERLIEYESQLEQTKLKYNAFISDTYNPNMASLDEAQAKLDEKSKEYDVSKEQLDSFKKQLDKAKEELDSGQRLLEDAKNTFDEGYSEYNSNAYKLNKAKEELSEKESEYNLGVTKLRVAKTELQVRENEYNTKNKEFLEKEPDALKEIEENEKKLSDSQKKIDELKLPTYAIDNRGEMPGGDGYSIYEIISNIVDSLAAVFPIFLYLVAALVTLTTMTRFVSDERLNIGTLKSLGYSDKDVTKKFTIYGFVAGMVGTVIGVILGHIFIPMVVYNAYSVGFTVPRIQLNFHLGITLIATLLSLISSVVPAYIVVKRTLKEQTASLLQPKAPKAGTKIFLERIKPIWKRMKFTQKVTARNIFRYKKRMLMTIFGVAGATAVLFAGFSVKYSISEINERQFKDIIKYNVIVALNNDLSEEEDKEIKNLLNSDEVKSHSSIYYEEVTKEPKGKDKQTIRLIVPKAKKEISKYISLMNRKTGDKISLSDDGVVISERLSTLLNVKVGDTFTYKDSNGINRKVKVSGICEMYAGHFMFMDSKEYQKVYGQEFKANAEVLNLNDASIQNTESEAAKFMSLSGVKGISQNTSLYNLINTIVKSLNTVMVVLIVISVSLAIVIQYNLTNINVTERIRELCTIKVLGFHNNETTMYIYRETIILSLIGIVVGSFIGIFLHHYIITVVPPDELMFNPVVWVGAYLIPLVVISIVTIILKWVVNRKLKNVDMLEALKSVD